MHLGLLIYGSLETLSGGYLYDRRLVDHLRRQGDQVEVIGLPWRGYQPALGDNLSPRLRERLQSLRADILLQDELCHPSLFWLNRELARRAAYPIVSIVHHLRSSEARPAWQNRFYAQIECRYLQSVDAFIYNSQTTRRAVEALAGKERPGVVVYPAGDRLAPEISEHQIAARANQPGPLRLLFLGNLIPRKGLHTLLEALAGLPRDSWRLSVAGSLDFEPSYARAMQRLAARLGLAGQVDFLGPQVDRSLVDLMLASHALVVPSSYEGFGIAYLEGMGFGLPAIAGAAGAAGEIVAPGQDGFLVEPGDAAGLAGCLSRLAENRELLLRLSLGARRRYLAHPTWEESAARARAFLQELIATCPENGKRGFSRK
jgi:glycosyltransferase involved in cell wall biosynthesis